MQQPEDINLLVPSRHRRSHAGGSDSFAESCCWPGKVLRDLNIAPTRINDSHLWQCSSLPAWGASATRTWRRTATWVTSTARCVILFSIIPCRSPNINRFSLNWAIVVISQSLFSLFSEKLQTVTATQTTQPIAAMGPTLEWAGTGLWSRKFGFFHGKLLGELREMNCSHARRALPSWYRWKSPLHPLSLTFSSIFLGQGQTPCTALYLYCTFRYPSFPLDAALWAEAWWVLASLIRSLGMYKCRSKTRWKS